MKKNKIRYEGHLGGAIIRNRISPYIDKRKKNKLLTSVQNTEERIRNTSENKDKKKVSQDINETIKINDQQQLPELNNSNSDMIKIIRRKRRRPNNKGSINKSSTSEIKYSILDDQLFIEDKDDKRSNINAFDSLITPCSQTTGIQKLNNLKVANMKISFRPKSKKKRCKSRICSAKRFTTDHFRSTIGFGTRTRMIQRRIVVDNNLREQSIEASGDEITGSKPKKSTSITKMGKIKLSPEFLIDALGESIDHWVDT